MVRYWSKVFPTITPTLLSDLDVKVMDLENRGVGDWMILVKVFLKTNRLDSFGIWTVVR